MKRALLLVSALIVTLLPGHVSAVEGIWVFCGGLPGCSAEFGEYLSSALSLLAARLPYYVYYIGIFFIMVGGAYMLLSAGNSERVEKGKKTIMWAVIGIFLASSTLDLVQFVLWEFGSDALVPTLQTWDTDDVVMSTVDILASSIFDLLNIALLGVAIYCGMWMVLAQGKQESFQKAYTGLFWAAVGAIIINVSARIGCAFDVYSTFTCS